jgi:hypothetical protein
MEYKFAREHLDYSDLASGQVFYSLPGHPAFPIRLASEIFQRCLELRGQGNSPCRIFDPCCGAAYHISMIAYLHWDRIRSIICSDVDDKAVQLAGRNLSLLTPAGMERRQREISTMLRMYGKDSHKQALESIRRLQDQVIRLAAIRPIQTRIFRANATDAQGLQAGLQGSLADIVFTDIPYGQHSHWQEVDSTDPIGAMLEALKGVLTLESVVAVASDKSQKFTHAAYRRLEKLQIGKRQVVILKLA